MSGGEGRGNGVDGFMLGMFGGGGDGFQLGVIAGGEAETQVSVCG